MSVSGSIPATVQIRRDHLLGLIGAVAALAACVTWAVTAFAFDTGTSGAVSSSHATATGVAAAQRAPPATFSDDTRSSYDVCQIDAKTTPGQHIAMTLKATAAKRLAAPEATLADGG